MGKIKLNLVSGAVVEKPFMNAFKANNNSYIVLDNEMNGSMGLPIILVCKLLDNKLVKITDQAEWQIVKEYLKNIIAGGQIEYIKCENEISADDIYYTQLTLPVPSFDALKNAYKIDEVASVEPVNNVAETVTPTVNVTTENVPQNIETSPVVPTVNNVDIQSFINPTPAVNNTPVVDNTPVVPNVNVETQTIPVVDNSVFQPMDMNSVMPSPIVDNTPVSNSTPVIESEPVIPNAVKAVDFADEAVNMNTGNDVASSISSIPTTEFDLPKVDNVENNSSNDDMFEEQRAAFMEACGNMFDALVNKFKKELENNNK